MTAAPGRIVALDLLRGVAVAGMILVVSPGSWNESYGWTQHAAWHGWTVADLVFPTFLFAVGAALGFSFPRALSAANRRVAWWRIARRTVLLIGLGLALNATEPPFDLATLRLPGILQRIALCYALVASLVLAPVRGDAAGLRHIDVRALLIAGLVLLIGWTAMLLGWPGRLDIAGNIGAVADRAIFGTAHLWRDGTELGGRVVYDPEGLLSTLGAAVNVIAGVLAATAWRRAPTRVLPMLVLGGIGMIALALLIEPALPINKRLWTASFALLTSGIGTLALVGCALATRSAAAMRAMAPVLILGGNAIVAFILSQLLGVFSALPVLSGGETPQGWGFAVAKRVVGDPYAASLLCAVGVLALVTAVLVPLHRRGLHLRL